MADSPLSEGLAVLSRFFVGGGTLHDTLRQVAELTVEAIGPADLAGMSMPVEGRPSTAVFTDPDSPAVDQAQYDSGEGPCLDAMRHGRVHGIDSTTAPGRWEAFRRACAEHGIHSTLSLPLIGDHGTIGAMNLYSRTDHGFTEPDRDAAEQFAVQAAVVLANAQAYWDAHEISECLGQAMTSRAVIEQAKGILMGAQRCGPDDAFELLVKASQCENVKLRDIAQRIVDNAAGGARRAEPAPGDDGL